MRAALIAVLACLTLALPAAAWKGERKGGVQKISAVKAQAESGDLVVIEGHITDVGTASGSRKLVTIEDESGSVYVRVPEDLLRKLTSGNDPQIGAHVRVTGKWGRSYLDEDVWGIQAQDAERID